jgi:hypothetical protein
MLHNEHTHAFEVETVLQLLPHDLSRALWYLWRSRTSIYVLRQNRSP